VVPDPQRAGDREPRLQLQPPAAERARFGKDREGEPRGLIRLPLLPLLPGHPQRQPGAREGVQLRARGPPGAEVLAAGGGLELPPLPQVRPVRRRRVGEVGPREHRVEGGGTAEQVPVKGRQVGPEDVPEIRAPEPEQAVLGLRAALRTVEHLVERVVPVEIELHPGVALIARGQGTERALDRRAQLRRRWGRPGVSCGSTTAAAREQSQQQAEEEDAPARGWTRGPTHGYRPGRWETGADGNALRSDARRPLTAMGVPGHIGTADPRRARRRRRHERDRSSRGAGLPQPRRAEVATV